MTSHPVRWKDFNGNPGSFMPVVANVSPILWGKDILEDMGVILTKDNQAFFDDIMEHEQLGLTGHLKGDHPQF